MNMSMKKTKEMNLETKTKVKSNDNGRDKATRKKDAYSEISLLCTLFPEIKTGAVSFITDRSLSLCSRILADIRGDKRIKERINGAFDGIKGETLASILRDSGLNPVEISYLLETSVNSVVKWIKNGKHFELRQCAEGHYFFTERKDDYTTFCPVCTSMVIPKDMKRVKIKKTLNQDEKNKFSMILFQVHGIIDRYYSSRRGNATLKYISEFRLALGWVMFGDVVIDAKNDVELSLSIPFDDGCESIGLNPLLEREKIYSEIMTQEKRIGNAKSRNRVPILDNIYDVFGFVNGYVTEFKSRGGPNRGATYGYKSISDSYPFFQDLRP